MVFVPKRAKVIELNQRTLGAAQKVSRFFAEKFHAILRLKPLRGYSPLEGIDMPRTTRQRQMELIREFFRRSVRLSLLPEGDYVADTFVSLGAVVISSALTGNRRPTYLAAFTDLPIDFVALVLILMDQSDLWWDEAYVRLRSLLNKTTEVLVIEDRACAAVDSLWESIQTPYDSLLDHYRRGCQGRSKSRPLGRSKREPLISNKDEGWVVFGGEGALERSGRGPSSPPSSPKRVGRGRSQRSAGGFLLRRLCLSR